jgi:homoserine kinase
MNAVSVFAPASVANVAVGFDILGFAIDKPGDEIVARFSDKPGLRIARITGDGGKLSLDPLKNTASFAAHKLLEHLGENEWGIELEIHKKMPFGSGLGSSAASAVGGVMAVNELLGGRLSKREILPFAVLGEQLADGAYHADNVAPSLFGGIVLIRSNRELDVHSIPVPEGLYASVVYPEVEVLTREARAILKKEVPLAATIEQCGNLAAFMVALYNSDFKLLSRSLHDVIIEPQRAQLIPHFYATKAAALNAGALGCSISGAGPSIFALSSSQAVAENVGIAMEKVYQEEGVHRQLYVSPINQRGAIRL